MKTKLVDSMNSRRIVNRIMAIQEELQELDELFEHTPKQAKRLEALEEEYTDLEQQRKELPRESIHHDLAIDNKEQ